jgi:ADP-ribose pyrophosphatase YjhB (NUDIX family)
VSENNEPAPFQFCTRCGAPALEPVSPREFRCRDCGFRHFVNPITAVAAILTNPKGEILLIERGIDPGRGQYCIPGGFVDLEETAEEAMEREIREEIQLQVTGLRYLYSFPNPYLFQGVVSPVLDLFYTARLPSFEGAQADLTEVRSVMALDPARIDFSTIAFPSVRKALRLYREREAAR